MIRAGTSICQQVLEPILEKFGRFAITFGYQSREAIEARWSPLRKQQEHRRSCPHQWDRGTFGKQVYARVDILPFCVEDRITSKREFGHWVMHHLDIDLLMHWTRSSVFCITISPRPRRVWIEWGDVKRGEPAQTRLMGTDYWQHVYPSLPKRQRPKYGPSCTGGNLQWRLFK